MEVTDEMIEAYRTAGAHIAIVDREKVKVRLAAVLEIVEREQRYVRREEIRRMRRELADVSAIGRDWAIRASAMTIMFNAETRIP